MGRRLAEKLKEICPNIQIIAEYQGQGRQGNTTYAVKMTQRDFGLLMGNTITEAHLLVDEDRKPLFKKAEVNFRFDVDANNNMIVY